MYNVLVCDDDSAIVDSIVIYLKNDGYGTLSASNGREAIGQLMNNEVHCIIMDIMMPVMDGLEACTKIREFSDVPVIMLTARGEETDELQGFKLGADEYISKPFSPKILTARVDAILRRTNAAGSDSETYGKITINRGAHTVTVEGRPVELSFKEFELLDYFMKNRNLALSRENILSNVWDYDYFGDARTIDTHVKKLRAKLGEQGEQIKTIWGMGYKFEES